MRSNGGVMTPEVATERPVAMMESGPVGGIIASAQVGQALGYANVISFDMGGTTAKASLVKDGEPTMAPGYYVGGYASGHPVMLPMIDVVEVGAGGGSIAWIDEVGALKVGPQSAGADPGPICYAAAAPSRPSPTPTSCSAGSTPTTSSAAQMKLDADAARARHRREDRQAARLDAVAAAQAIVEIAISKMSLAVREVSVAEGLRPARFRAGRLRRRGRRCTSWRSRASCISRRVIVPLFPSHFSALGMLLADERHDFVRTYLLATSRASTSASCAKVYDEMATEARGESAQRQDAEERRPARPALCRAGFHAAGAGGARGLRKGDRKAIRTAFDALYEHRYAHPRRTSRSRWSTSGSPRSASGRR